MNFNKSSLLITVFLGLLVPKSDAQTTTTFTNEGILYGKVKSVKEYTINLDKHGKPIKKDTSGNSIYTFNERGDETSFLNFFTTLRKKPLGVYPEQVYTTVYDDKGNRIKTYWHNSSGKGLITYNENGKIAERTVYNYTLREKSIIKYDENGHETEDDLYFENGTVKYQTILNYKDNGNEIDVDEHSNDSAQWKSVIKYSKDGYRRFEIDSYLPDGSLNSIQRENYEAFDEHGNWTKKIIHLDMDQNKVKVHTDISVTIRELTYY